MTWTDEIWEAAVFKTEWDAPDDNGSWLRYKLYRVPRCAIDDYSDEDDAHLLHGIDEGNVRRVDVFLDDAFQREIEREALDRLQEIMQSAPPEAAQVLQRYCGV